jgi:putative protease
MPELLAPAGSPEALRAAVQNGAGAVYMGFGDFNARRNAKNFTPEEFAQAVRYCHLRGVKVYLTLNTLLFDRELAAAAKTAAAASDMGADAVLVQDWGVLRAVRAAAPGLPIHASTQMSICSLDGAAEAARLGISRVVLAREMTRRQIAEVCAKSGVETEVFVHGAHCMCYSGQCAMSALIGGRSGNRGTCAQPCRLPYSLNGPCGRGCPLSLKDLSLADHIPELIDMGVASFKIEGRMKRAEYVAVVTGIFSALIKEKRRPTKQEWLDLYSAFSRSGFTDGYYMDKKGPQMFGVRSGDAKEPAELFAAARATYENRENFAVPVEMSVSVLRGKPARLVALDYSGNRAEAVGPVPEEAVNRPLDGREMADRLKKTGGTAFSCENVHVELDEGLSLPVSAINALRRGALDALAEKRCAAPKRKTGGFRPEAPETRGADFPMFTVSVASLSQITPALLDTAPARIYVPLELFGALDPAAFAGRTTQLCAVPPRICSQDEKPELRSLLETAKKKGAKMVMIGNIAHFRLACGLGLPLCGDFGLNVTNSESLAFLRAEGLTSQCVSFELRAEQIRDMDKRLPLEAIVYGRLPLMLIENCLMKNAARGDCMRACEGKNALTDRTGASFPVLPAFGCRNEIENSKVLFLADRDEYRRLGLTFARLRFTDETPEACAAVARRYLGRDGWSPEDFTRGLFFRSVE